MSTTRKLGDVHSPQVREAMTRECPLCKAPPGERCTFYTGPCKGRPLAHRVVHYQRAKLKTA